MAGLRRGEITTQAARRLALIVVLLLAGASFAAVTWRTAPPVDADADVPLLVAPTSTSGPPETTTAVPTSAPAPPETVPSTAPPAAPIAVPKNEYAPEPIQEIGVIEIPKIGLRHTIFHGITMRNIDRGPSHWPGTAMPGEVGNTVFAGHRVTKTRPFRNIDQLVPGDEVVFTVAGVRSVYAVTGSKVVLPTAMEIVNPTPEATGTLFACHPPGSARYRYVVLLALKAPPPDVPPPDAQAPAATDPAPPEASSG